MWRLLLLEHRRTTWRGASWRILATLGVVVASLMLAASAERPVVAAEPVYGSPITITKGGTYTGNWESLDPNVPAVRVRTAEPVIIERARIKGRGHLIKVDPGYHAKVTVRNNYGYGLNPETAGRAPGRFLAAEEVADLRVANNYMEGTSGVYVRKWVGDSARAQTIIILRNRAKNIDGRHSDGAGGFSQTGFDRVQFLQFDKVRSIPGVEIAWNEVVNEPYKSRVEDNISMYLSSGRGRSLPIKIHDNFIRGAYPARPAQDSYSGGGIMLGDGSASTLQEAACCVRAYANQVVSTTNYGIAVAAGHQNEFYENRIVSSGLLADGSPIAAQNVGAYIWDTNGDKGKSPPTFYANSARDNTVGWAKKGGDGRIVRNDWWFPDCAEASDGTSLCKGNRGLPNPITSVTEGAELAYWQNKLTASGVKIGPQP